MDTAKKIGVMTATIVGMNAMIGAGIFGVPAALGAAVGPAGLITYLFVIFAVWCMGSSMAQLAEFYPSGGSFFTYARQWGGHTIGLLAAGLYLAGVVVAMSLILQIVGTYLQHYIPCVSSFSLGLIMLGLLTALNMAGVQISQAGQIILIGTTVFPLLAITGICLMNGNWSNFTPFAPFGWRPVFSAARIVIFGFFGFECAASLFNLVENPKKNVPIALVTSILLVGILYTIFVGSMIFAIPLSYFSVNGSLSEILAQLFPQYGWLLEMVHFAILSAMVGTVHSLIWACGSLLAAFCKEAIHNSPFSSLVKKGMIADWIFVPLVSFGIFICYVTLADRDLLFSLTAFFIVLALVLAMGSLLFESHRQTMWQRIQTIVGLLTAGMIIYFAGESLIERIGTRVTRVDVEATKMV